MILANTFSATHTSLPDFQALVFEKTYLEGFPIIQAPKATFFVNSPSEFSSRNEQLFMVSPMNHLLDHAAEELDVVPGLLALLAASVLALLTYNQFILKAYF